MHRMSARSSLLSGPGLSLILAGFTITATAQVPRVQTLPAVQVEFRTQSLPVDVERVGLLPVGTDGSQRGDCSVVTTHTDASFTGGSYNAQGGFAEQEIAAASYVVSPSEFPVRIETMEMIFATYQATEPTTTEWSVLIWDGPPSTGILVAEFSSDGKLIPHLEMGPGTNATNIVVTIDPTDPEQIYIFNDSGTNTISFGFRIDEHNQQIQDPCFVAPPSCCNAFPTTDRSGLLAPTNNWLYAIDCGVLGCRAGWSRFSQLGVCTPSGDWVMRLTWASTDCGPELGACCLADGTCTMLSEDTCLAQDGVYQGDVSDCNDVVCPEPTQACCFESTGGCVDLTESNCLAAGGVPGGFGTDCTTFECFPEGACCLPDGTCEDGVSPDVCTAMGGTFQGDGTDCFNDPCPDPTGACCFSTDFCLELTEDECLAAGATWAGAGSDCADDDGSGTADVCEDGACPDLDGDGEVGLTDLSTLLTNYGEAGGMSFEDGDIDGDGDVDLTDLSLLLTRFGDLCG